MFTYIHIHVVCACVCVWIQAYTEGKNRWVRWGIEDGSFNCPMEERRCFLHFLKLQIFTRKKRERWRTIEFIWTYERFCVNLPLPMITLHIYRSVKFIVADEESKGTLECNWKLALAHRHNPTFKYLPSQDLAWSYKFLKLKSQFTAISKCSYTLSKL